MEITQAYYQMKIKEGLSLRQRDNPQYYLRAYARDLDVYQLAIQFYPLNNIKKEQE